MTTKSTISSQKKEENLYPKKKKKKKKKKKGQIKDLAKKRKMLDLKQHIFNCFFFFFSFIFFALALTYFGMFEYSIFNISY
jgi:hypothetical protein